MKYYSEVLGKIFDSEEECLIAEKKHNECVARKAREDAAKKAEEEKLAEVVTNAFDKFLEATMAYAEFIDKYEA